MPRVDVADAEGTMTGQAAAQTLQYDSEVRFGVVMYGGVSLAIYINGVAHELYEMACATPRPGTPPDSRDGTRRVYRWLAALLGDMSLRHDACRWLAGHPGTGIEAFFELPDVAKRLPTAVHKRFVVDVVAGTSAGGINGLFLAKALANGEPFSPLRDLWIREGDVDKLINDRGSRRDDASLPPVGAQPASLLNSDRMYRRLVDAMEAMTREAADGGGVPVADELDLFVTTTDIRGSVVGLRLADKLVVERRHRQVFHLRHRAAGAPLARNDLAPENHAFLAYVARCTSSFPFVFEPMTLDAIERGGGTVGDPQRRRWRALFTRTEGLDGRVDPLERAYGDGGYLDNKPFGHAIDALSKREAELPVERKLVYIEPSPEHPEDAELARGGRREPTPDAVHNALAALLTIPRAETIREDLEAVLLRNRRIERVDLIVRQGEADLEAGSGDDPYLRALAADGTRAPAWDRMRLADLRRYYGDAFLPYRRLRVYTTTDKLAERLAPLWGIDVESDHWYALRTLVRVWRERTFCGDTLPDAPGPHVDAAPAPTMNTFLSMFDLRYRTRRLRFLLRRIDALWRLTLEHDGQALRRPVAQMPELHQRLVKRLKDHQLDLEALREHDRLDNARAALVQLRARFIAARDEVLAAELELHDLGGAAAHEQRHLLALLLRDVLDRVLGAPCAPRDDADARPRLREHLPADVADQLDRADALPQVDRSLQERVVARARLLYDAMTAREATALQKALVADLDGLGRMVRDLVKGTPQRQALAVVGALLGRPRWEFDVAHDGTLLPRVTVDDVGDATLDTPEGRILRRLLGWYVLRFDSFDQMSLPLYYGTDTGEPATVDVVRISPEDATAIVDERAGRRRRKLAGTALGNFGGFLDERWRRNDILWGRLDGAERLIHALLPSDALQGLRGALVDAAQRTIARELLAPAERAQLGGVVLGALDQLRRDTEKAAAAAAPRVHDHAKARMHALLQALDLGDPARRGHVERVVGSLFDDRGLLEYLRSAHEVDRRLDPKRTMRQAARALTVAGRVLEGVADGSDVQPLLRWTSRIGLVAQGVLTAAVPGSLWALVSRHWLTLLYLFEAAMVLIGTLLASPDMRAAGLTAFAVTAIVHGAIVFARDLMREKPPWRSKVVWLSIVFVATLAGAGGWALHKVPLECLRPATECVRVDGR